MFVIILLKQIKESKEICPGRDSGEASEEVARRDSKESEDEERDFSEEKESEILKGNIWKYLKKYLSKGKEKRGRSIKEKGIVVGEVGF